MGGGAFLDPVLNFFLGGRGFRTPLQRNPIPWTRFASSRESREWLRRPLKRRPWLFRNSHWTSDRLRQPDEITGIDRDIRVSGSLRLVEILGGFRGGRIERLGGDFGCRRGIMDAVAAALAEDLAETAKWERIRMALAAAALVKTESDSAGSEERSV